MIISFKSIGYKLVNIDYNKNGNSIIGTVLKIKKDLYKLNANISATIEKNCDICGNINTFLFEEKLDYFISDGIYNKPLENNDIIIELEENIDFDYIMKSEIESIKCDYYRCKSCID